MSQDGVLMDNFIIIQKMRILIFRIDKYTQMRELKFRFSLNKYFIPSPIHNYTIFHCL